MPTTPIPDHLQTLLAQPHPSVIAMVRPDGQPVSVATWYLYENGRVLVNMDASRKRLSYLRDNPRVSLTVLADNWYTHVSLRGRATEIVEDTDFADIDRICAFYMGSPYSDHERKRVSAYIDIDDWHAWRNGHAITD
jgi:PPOX class probable F420-dependent enzyme